MDLVSQTYWDDSYAGFEFRIANDVVTEWIAQRLTDVAPADVFEFGCYPGRYLAFLGKMGWTVNGMDLTPEIAAPRFKTWLKEENVKANLLAQGDVLDYAASTANRYHLVCSFGFVEHFRNFMEVIRLHDRILLPNGWLMITVPNFRGFVQHALHAGLNKRGLSLHYLPSMNPNLWRRELEKQGYDIKWCGYFGHFDFWYDKAQRNGLQKLSLKAIEKVKPLLKTAPNSSAYAPYCGIFARKLPR